MKWQGKSVRSSTGGRIKRSVGKKKHEMGRESTLTQLGETRKKQVFGFGSNSKIRLYKGSHANVTDGLTGKTSIADIETVESNAANRNYVDATLSQKVQLFKQH
jgi:small subunit ribosomal protein S8e